MSTAKEPGDKGDAHVAPIHRAGWDGWIRFDSDCIINGYPVKAGTSWGPFAKSKETTRSHERRSGTDRRIEQKAGAPCRRMILRRLADRGGIGASAASTTPQKPRGAYVPLTEHEIDLIRACLDDGTYTQQEQKDIGLLCNMATNCLLYAQEIDRLRTTPTATEMALAKAYVAERDVLLAARASAASATPRSECPYCTSDNEAIRSTYYDQTCEGCVKRMGQP